MKRITALVLSSIILLLTSCDTKNTKDTDVKIAEEQTVKETTAPAEGEGTYTADGRTYTGKVRVESDGLKFFTVTCEGDPVQMIEVHFKNEAAARKGGSFKPGSLTPIDNNEAGIMFGIGYKSADAAEGPITVTGSGGKNVLELNSVKLTVPGKSIIVSGKIPF